VKVGKKTRVGVVVSDKAAKTIQVSVLRTKKEKILGKIIKIYTKYAVHDEKEESKPGDLVRIEECRPLSKTKRWKLIEIIQKTSVEAIELKEELATVMPVIKPVEDAKAEKGV